MLDRLKLTAIRDQLDSLVDEAGRRELTIREALALFCEREIARKDERRTEMSIGLARFPYVRDLDGFDFASRNAIRAWRSCSTVSKVRTQSRFSEDDNLAVERLADHRLRQQLRSRLPGEHLLGRTNLVQGRFPPAFQFAGDGTDVGIDAVELPFGQGRLYRLRSS
jgi:hypothetical protein